MFGDVLKDVHVESDAHRKREPAVHRALLETLESLASFAAWFQRSFLVTTLGIFRWQTACQAVWGGVTGLMLVDGRCCAEFRKIQSAGCHATKPGT